LCRRYACQSRSVEQAEEEEGVSVGFLTVGWFRVMSEFQDCLRGSVLKTAMFVGMSQKKKEMNGELLYLPLYVGIRPCFCSRVV
jgi:hypothetical protein